MSAFETLEARKYLIAFLVGALLVGFGAVSFAQESDLPKVEQQVLREPNIEDDLYVFVTCWRNLEFFDVHIEAFHLAGDILGVETRVLGPPDYNTQEQIDAVRTAMGMDPDGIIVYPPDTSLEPVVNEAEEAGIPVVTVTGDLPNSKRTAYVGITQHKVGEVGGAYLADLLDGEGKVGLLTITATMFQDRADGYRDTFEKYEGLEIVAKGDTQGDFETGISTATAILSRHPDLDAFVCVDSVGARSAVTALREKGMSGQVEVIGMDRNNDTVQSVGEGKLAASVAQKGHLTTFYAMNLLYNLKHNPMPITTDNEAAGVTAAPIRIDTGVELVTEDNWEYWLRENEEWKYWQEE